MQANVLKKVTIKNFRSIERQEFEPSQLTLFVGQNDSGKSNFLRALNLFFNAGTDPGQSINFATDFSTHAKVGRGKAKQIEIWLDIEPPPSFSDRSLIRWRRTWREGSPNYTSQEIKHVASGRALSGRSKAILWLGRIRYKYVPAIKGADYFSMLLRDVHDVLAETVDSQLRGASTDFIQSIRAHTAQISELTNASLGLQSRLQLPTDLRALFEVLDFETTSEAGPKSLRQRGDGIKVRHISAILKFLSDQEKKLSGPGRPRPTTIWGYEEPENNLELSRSFHHAEELFEFSKDIQVLISTHSPAFYSLLSKGPSVSAYSVNATSEGTLIHRIDGSGIAALDESLGLMTLVAPYVKAKADELRAVEEHAEKLALELRNRQKLIVLVGGETDEQYVATSIVAIDPELAKKVVVKAIGQAKATGAENAGDQNLLRFARELSLKPELHKCQILVLLDCDVGSVPTDAGDVRFKRIPIDSTNEQFRKGIENLLPPAVAAEKYYARNEKVDPYGARTVVERLDKKKLCEAYCDENSDIPLAWEQRFVSFRPIVEWIREQLT